MTNAIPYIIRKDSVTVVLTDTPYIIRESDKKYKKAIKFIKAEQWDELKKLIDVKNHISEFLNGKIKVVRGRFEYNGQVIHNSLTKRIMQMHSDGFPVDPMINFLVNLMENPSFTAVNGLYDFLETNNLPITTDVFFLAYKRIREDYTDVRTGTIDNSVGKVVSMPRNEVQDNSNITCAPGLHVCSREYLQHFSGEKVILVKVNPKDVVSVPKDYNFSKMRTCKYEVISELSLEDAFEDIASNKPVHS